MRNVPVLLGRPGALLGVGAAAWPVMAYAAASAAGVDGCVRAHGVVGFLATHGALMGPTPSCPAAAVGHSGPMASAVAFVLVAATLATAAHVVVAAVSSQLLEWVQRLAAAIASIIAPVIIVARGLWYFRLPPAAHPLLVARRVVHRVPWRRGPPWGYAAV